MDGVRRGALIGFWVSLGAFVVLRLVAPPPASAVSSVLLGVRVGVLALAMGLGIAWIVARTRERSLSTPGPPANWYSDPWGRARLRYWDGSAWTEHEAP